MTFTLPPLLNHVDGVCETPALERGNTLRDPNDRSELQPQLSSSPEQVEAALVSADAAWREGEWEHTSVDERANLLDRIADALSDPAIAERMAHADSITTGAVINITRRMAALVPYVFRHASAYIRAGNLSSRVPGPRGDVEYFRRPWGPALLVSPWNGPTAIGSHKIASALAAGAPCIYKPSEWAPHSALIMADVIADSALPRGVFNLTCGSRHIGSQLVEDQRIKAISFTGGTVGGQVIARACAERFTPLQLELGGNNPLIVMADANLDSAAEGIVYGLSNLNAQWCRALGRLIVHESVREPLLEKVLARFKQLSLGHSLDPDSDMGPLIHAAQYDSVQAEIARLESRGGRILHSTPMPDLPGYFAAPTLIEGCDPADTVEEIFGPVAAVHSFSTDEEALALANGTDYGLAAYIYSADEAHAFTLGREIRTGGVKVNGYSLLSLSGDLPRGAWGLSGLGEEGAGQSIDFFTGARTLGVSAQDPIGGRSAA